MRTRGPPAPIAILAALVLAACNRGSRIEPEPTPASASATPPAPSGSAASAVPGPAEPDPFRWPADYRPPEVWETQEVVVDGVTEMWTLRWKKPPRFNGCAPLTSCECAGVEWGLTGDLELVRGRPGAPTERLDLGALRPGGAQIPGFVKTVGDPTGYRSLDDLKREGVHLEEVVRRPRAQAMVLRDYDHDGRSTEFVFQTGFLACGDQPSVLVGISRADPHLHVFHTVEKPDAPLTMTYLSAWETLLTAHGPTVDLPTILCGDHGGGGAYMTLRIDAATGLHFVEEGALDCAHKGRKLGPPHEKLDPPAGSAHGASR